MSPQLSWSPVANAKSYVVIMEDPDAKPVTPFVHWVAWNISASAVQLSEGLQEQLRLTEPEGAPQGATTRGSPGYYGPRPPVMDPPRSTCRRVLTVTNCWRGRVIAKGELVGTFQQQPRPLK